MGGATRLTAAMGPRSVHTALPAMVALVKTAPDSVATLVLVCWIDTLLVCAAV